VNCLSFELTPCGDCHIPNEDIKCFSSGSQIKNSMFCMEIIKKEKFLDCKLNKVENSNGNYNFFDFVNKVSYYFRYNNK
jgi:hypothetical protein